MANVSPTGRSWNLPCLYISTETTSWLKKMAEWLLTSLFFWVPQDNFSAALLSGPDLEWCAFAGLIDGCRGNMVRQWQQPHSGRTVRLGQQWSQTLRSYGQSYSWQKAELAALTKALELRKDKRYTWLKCLCYCSYLWDYLYIERPSNNRRKKETPNSEGNKITECVTLETWSPYPWLP